MNKRTWMLCAGVVIVFIMVCIPLFHSVGWFRPINKPTGAPDATAAPSSPLSSLYLRESHAYIKPVQAFEYRLTDGAHTVSFTLSSKDEPLVVTVDQSWVDQLSAFIPQYDMMAWDGFRHQAAALLDGVSFSVNFSFADGITVSASGYGGFPENYPEASDKIQTHFLQLLPPELRDW